MNLPLPEIRDNIVYCNTAGISSGIPDKISSALEHRPTLEIRAMGDKLVGLAIPFNRRSKDLGGFCEIVRPQAVTALSGDVVALYNHDAGAVLGRTPKTLQLTADERGLSFSLTVAPTAIGRDVLALVDRGDLAAASFGFVTRADRWTKDGALPIRELLDIELREISLVAFPAYADTNVEMARRSLTAWQANQDNRPVILKSIAWLKLRQRAR